MTEREMANLISNAFHADESGESMEKLESHCTLKEDGVLTDNEGLVVRCRDGSEFQIIIVKSN